jgi:hypothetical protein
MKGDGIYRLDAALGVNPMTRLVASRCIALGFALLLGACQQPAVEMKPPAFQQSAVTVRDWDSVASRIATGLQQHGLLGTPDPRTGQVSATGPFYIHVLADGSGFLRSVRDSLVSQLLANGGEVAVSPAGATVINLDVDWVRWGSRPHGPGGAGTLVGGAAAIALAVADAPSFSWQAAAVTALGVGIAADILAAVTPTQGSEAAWRAYIVTPTSIVWQRREVMYVATSDLPLYQTGARGAPIPSPGSRTMLVSQPLRFVR